MKENIDVKTHLLKRNEHIFLIDDKTQQSLTYDEFSHEALTLAAYLLKQGLKPEERLIILMDNSILCAILYFACLYAGIIAVPINSESSEKHLSFVLKNTKANFIFIDQIFLSKIPEEYHPTVLLSENYHSENKEELKNLALHPHNIALIIFTSGTTAEPKGVAHRVIDFVLNGLDFIHLHSINEENRFYNLLPMSYLGGYYNLLLIPYLASSSVVMTHAFNPELLLSFWQKIEKHAINTLWLVPTIIALLLEMDRKKGSIDYRHLIKLVLVGTAPLASSLKKYFTEKYHLALYENYGLSETLFLTTQTLNQKEKSVGKLLPHVHCKIVNTQDEENIPLCEGEIYVKTPSLMQGYLDHPPLSADDWFLTGDLGYFDEQQNLLITGRKKDLIIKGGINISPAVIEEVMYRHPEINECAAVSISHPLKGEDIYVVLTLKSPVDFLTFKNTLKKTAKELLSKIEEPTDYILLENLPHTFTGKIQKAKIRAYLQDYIHIKPFQAKTTDTSKNFFKPSTIASQAKEALSIAYNNKVYELIANHEKVTILSLGEAYFDLPLYDFSHLPYPQSYHYSHSRGVIGLRKILAQYFVENYEVKFDPANQIILTAGSKIAIFMTLMALINPEDEVIIHEPAWVSYKEQIQLCHGIPISIPQDQSIYDIEKYISNRTKVIIINNPNNPRGSLLSLAEISHLYELAKKYHLYILSDEAYSDFVEDKAQFVSIGHFDKDLNFSIICNSISKNLSISGWRIGYVITNENLINQILKINQHLITCPPTILQFYIENHFHKLIKITKPQIMILLEKRKKVIYYLENIGLCCLPGNATFYIFLKITPSHLTSTEFSDILLDEYHIAVVPGKGYGDSCDHFIRLSIGTEPLDKIFSALDTIKNLIHRTHISAPLLKMHKEESRKNYG